MAKFLINKGSDALSGVVAEREVKADDMRIRDEFLDFDDSKQTVFRVKKSLVNTVEVVEE
jgi:hypothetical protein